LNIRFMGLVQEDEENLEYCAYDGEAPGCSEVLWYVEDETGDTIETVCSEHKGMARKNYE
jgi:hypothetical protein